MPMSWPTEQQSVPHRFFSDQPFQRLHGIHLFQSRGCIDINGESVDGTTSWLVKLTQRRYPILLHPHNEFRKIRKIRKFQNHQIVLDNDSYAVTKVKPKSINNCRIINCLICYRVFLIKDLLNDQQSFILLIKQLEREQTNKFDQGSNEPTNAAGNRLGSPRRFQPSG